MYKNLDVQSVGISGTQSEVIELALSYRYQGMSLDMASFARQVQEYGLPHARRLIDSARIKIGTFRLPFVWDAWEEDGSSYKKGLEQLPKVAEWAAALGCLRCVTTVNPASDERPYHENFEFIRKRIAEMADVLRPHKIQLGLEFVATSDQRQGRAFQFIHTFDALVMIAKMTSAANVGVVVDLWQMQVAGASVDEIKALRPEQIVAVYLSDIAADADLETTDETGRLLPGETGVIPVAAALTALAEIGYDGPVIPRAHRAGDVSREAMVKLAAERVEQAWKDAGLNAKGKLSTATK